MRDRFLILLGFLVFLLAARPVLAVVGAGVFELDGDSNDNSAVPGVDFDQVYLGTSGALVSRFVTDPDANPAVDDSTTFGQGDKDTDPAKDWNCNVDSNVTPKDNILHGYAALYSVDSALQLFFGADREVSTGDANIGMWFFQNPIGCVPASSGGTGSFTGHKTHGDLFIVSEFTRGGTVSTVKVFKWTDPTPSNPENGDECLGDGVDCTAAHEGVPAITGADCQTGANTEVVCATVNGASFTPEWLATALDTHTYYEGGVNLSRMLGSVGCFSQFMLQTRTSATPGLGSTIKDYVLGDLNTCSTIQGDKFEDLDADGQPWETGEPKLQGWTINLYNASNNNLVDTKVTDASGHYKFENVRAGNYKICEVNLNSAIWTQSFPATALSPCPANAPNGYSLGVTPGSSITGNDLGNFRKGEISGDKFIDLDGDGVFDTGEGCPASPDPNHAGCAGVTVKLDGADGMGNAVHLTTTTDENGAYSFTNLVPGTYTVTVVDATGFQCSFPGTCSYSITLGSDEVVTGKDFGDYSLGTIVIIKDARPDDPQDFEFSRSFGINFFLDNDTDNTLSDTAIFASLTPGSYTVTELAPPSPWQFTSLVCVDPDGGTTTVGATANIDLDSDETVTCTFTNEKPAGPPPGTIIVEKKAIGGDDTFAFTTTGGDGLDGSFQITTSSGYGSKTFTGIDTGSTYSVTESPPPAGWVFVGTNCAGSFTVPPGETVTCTFTNEKPSGPPPPPPPVGGELYSVDKSALVQPYVLGLLGLLGAVAAAFAVRRRRKV